MRDPQAIQKLLHVMESTPALESEVKRSTFALLDNTRLS